MKVLIKDLSKAGVCKVIAEGGLLSGYLTIRFIIIFLSCLFTLIIKFYSLRISPFPFPLLTLPGLITGIIFTWHPRLHKTFLRHPSLLLLPMFSFFTFESNAEKCCQKNDNLTDDVEIRFSLKATCFNIIFTLMGVIARALILPQVDKTAACLHLWKVLPLCSSIMFAFFLPGILFTIIFLFCCSPHPSNCCCSSPSFCFSSSSLDSHSSCFPPLEFGVFKPSSPDKVFVIDQRSGQVKEVKEFALEEGEAGSIERREMPKEGREEKEEV